MTNIFIWEITILFESISQTKRWKEQSPWNGDRLQNDIVEPYHHTVPQKQIWHSGRRMKIMHNFWDIFTLTFTHLQKNFAKTFFHLNSTNSILSWLWGVDLFCVCYSYNLEIIEKPLEMPDWNFLCLLRKCLVVYTFSVSREKNHPTFMLRSLMGSL